MNELERNIKRYKLDELLFLLAKQSREMYLTNISIKEIEYKRVLFGMFLQKATQPLPAWEILESNQDNLFCINSLCIN